MKLVTFNMQNRPAEPRAERRERLARIAGLLRSTEPDLVCLQECLIDDFEFLRTALAANRAGFTPRDDGQTLGEGNPIFLMNSRWEMLGFHTFWLSATPEAPSRSWRSAHHRIASVMKIRYAGEDRRQIHVLNVHLDHRSALARRKSLVLIRRELQRWFESPDNAFIVCGDFNIRPRRLQGTGFIGEPIINETNNSMVMLDPAIRMDPVQDGPTFLGAGRFGLFRARIDYCLHSDNLKCLEYGVTDPDWEGRRLSDHRIVRAEFA